MMIAYFILVHRYPEQFKRLFTAIYHPDNFYVVHTDKRSGSALHREVETYLSAFPNTSLLESKSALWGGYSLVDAELRGMKELLNMSVKWQFFINLSGQDFPLKTQQYMMSFLQKNSGREFLKIANQRTVRPGTLARIEEYCFEFANRIIRTPFRRRFLRGATPYIGNQWMILSRTFCEFLITSPEVRRFRNFYRHTFIADEGFFQTVIMNTSFASNIVDDDLRAIDWVPEGTIKLRPRTFTMHDASFLTSSQHLFARKFDQTVDTGILTLLEAHLCKSVLSRSD